MFHWTVLDFTSSPHYMVVLRIKSISSRALISRIVAPSSFGGARPKGCERQPLPHPPEEGVKHVTEVKDFETFLFLELLSTAPQV